MSDIRYQMSAGSGQLAAAREEKSGIEDLAAWEELTAGSSQLKS
jgi:hypothetical protein